MIFRKSKKKKAIFFIGEYKVKFDALQDGVFRFSKKAGEIYQI